MNKKAIVAGLVLLAAAAVAAWYGLRYGQQVEPNELVLHGNVDMRQVSLAFNGSGRIETLAVREGEHVTPGQELGTLDAATLQLQVRQAEAQLAAAEQTLRRLQVGARPQELAQASANARAAQAQLELNRQQLQRLQGAYEAVSKLELDNARGQQRVAQARLEQAQQAYALLQAGTRREDIAVAVAQRDALQAQLQLLQRNLADTRLIAPSGGVIRSRLQEVGDLTTPLKPVYALALLDSKWVRVYVPEPALGKVREGMPASIRIDSAPDQPLQGQVGYIASVAEFTPKTVQTEELRTSLVYEVRVQAQDPGDRLRLGMPATVTIGLRSPPQPATGGRAPAALATASAAVAAAEAAAPASAR